MPRTIGSGSRMPKNIRILRIRIRNTDRFIYSILFVDRSWLPPMLCRISPPASPGWRLTRRRPLPPTINSRRRRRPSRPGPPARPTHRPALRHPTWRAVRAGAAVAAAALRPPIRTPEPQARFPIRFRLLCRCPLRPTHLCQVRAGLRPRVLGNRYSVSSDPCARMNRWHLAECGCALAELWMRSSRFMDAI